jgi:hypothetical protein
MLEEVESDLATANRAQLASKITHGLLLVLKAELVPLTAAESTIAARQVRPGSIIFDGRLVLTVSESCPQLYRDVLARTDPLIEPVEKQVAELEAERSALLAEHKAAGKERSTSVTATDDGSEEDGSLDAIPLSKEQRARTVRLTTLKARLRGQSSPVPEGRPSLADFDIFTPRTVRDKAPGRLLPRRLVPRRGGGA